jgi:hypothetical protein
MCAYVCVFVCVSETSTISGQNTELVFWATEINNSNMILYEILSSQIRL